MTQFNAAIASNLSYVLHEPSRSEVVKDFVSRLARERARVERIWRRFDSLPDDDLRPRIVMDGRAVDESLRELSSWNIVSVAVGVPRLLPRLLQVSGMLRADARVAYTCLDGTSCPRRETRQLFRAPASICAPNEHPSTAARWVFAAALVRPGEDSILLRLHAFPTDAGQFDHVWADLARDAEATIREFVLQWDCQRALWDSPAEETLPEFSGEGDRTT